MVTKGREEADGVCLCTMLDVRCTILEVRRVARRDGGRRGRLAADAAYVRWTTEALGGAYVRSTKYDVRLQSLRALRGGGGGA